MGEILGNMWKTRALKPRSQRLRSSTFFLEKAMSMSSPSSSPSHLKGFVLASCKKKKKARKMREPNSYHTPVQAPAACTTRAMAAKYSLASAAVDVPSPL